MFGVSITELIVIFLIALVLFGPDELPRIARQLGKLMGDLRKTSDSVRREFYNTVYPPAQDIRRDFAAGASQLRALKAEVMAPPIVPPPTSPPASHLPPASSNVADDATSPVTAEQIDAAQVDTAAQQTKSKTTDETTE